MFGYQLGIINTLGPHRTTSLRLFVEGQQQVPSKAFVVPFDINFLFCCCFLLQFQYTSGVVLVVGVPLGWFDGLVEESRACPQPPVCHPAGGSRSLAQPDLLAFIPACILSIIFVHWLLWTKWMKTRKRSISMASMAAVDASRSPQVFAGSCCMHRTCARLVLMLTQRRWETQDLNAFV